MPRSIQSFRDFPLEGRRVLLRLDINSPLKDGRISDTTRIERSLPTLTGLLEAGARVAILAHQGDSLDYQNLGPLSEHAALLAAHSGFPVSYLDDVCGDAALRQIEALAPGQAILLGNVRYLAEEISTFETVVPLTAREMTRTWLVRRLAPLFDLYVNDAFSAAHRACPSMIAFQELLPTAAGDLLFREYEELSRVLQAPARPAVFVLGGAKISDAFGMLEQVLRNKTADRILAVGVTGQIFLLASGRSLGEKSRAWLEGRGLLSFVEQARTYLENYADQIDVPLDLAYEKEGQRREIAAAELPLDDVLFLDIGEQTIQRAEQRIREAGSLFVNGPAGVYEDERFAEGTRRLWQAIALAPGYSVMGGGDSVNAANRFIDLANINYVSTAGGAMVRFMTGQTLPLIEAMEAAAARSRG